MSLGTGQVLNGRYRIVKLLGQGGFGAVYRAWDVNLNIPCALKENSETSPVAVRQFAREATMLATLRHANLPKVTDHFSIPEKGQYLVMEFIDGEDLQEKLQQTGGPLPEALVLDWMGQILDALVYLHEMQPPVIHRDIKPANIRITAKGQAFLVDFGIAKLYDPEVKTTVGARAVTPGYSPHEQYGQGATDVRSDIYALGATMYTLLTGEVPPESVGRMLEDPLIPPMQLNPALSPGLAAVVQRALEVDPRKRFQSAAEFRRAWMAVARPAGVPLPTDAPNVMVAPGQRSAAASFDANGAVKAPTAPTEAVPGRQSRPVSRPVAEKPGRSRLWIGLGIGTVVALVFLVGAVILGSMGIKAMRQRTQVASAPTAAAVLPSAMPEAAHVEPTVAPRPPAVVPATAPPQPLAKGPLRIGVLAPLSGAVPQFGISVREAVEMAADEWNQRGGVLGQPVEVLVKDSQCDAEPALNAARGLVEGDGVHYIVGEVCSKASIPVSEYLNPRGVVQISPTSTNLRVTVDEQGNVKPFVFRACFIDPFQGFAMARFAYSRGHRTAFILRDPDNPYVEGLAMAFEEAFTAQGGKIAGNETYNTNITDFRPLLEKVKESKAAVVYVPDYYNIANVIAAQAREMGIDGPLLGGDGWDSADLDLKALDGGFFTNHYDPGDDRPIARDWLARYGERYKDDRGNPKVPDAIATLSYDAINMLLEAIQQAGTDDPLRVKDVLAGIEWEGVTGLTRFNEQHNPVKSVAIIAIRNGQRVFDSILNP